MLQRWRHARRCRRLAAACREPLLARYLEACAALAIDRVDTTPLIAVDLETTGLDKINDRIVAIGWTLVDNGRVCFAGNRRLLIRPAEGNAGNLAEGGVGQSAAFHELRDSDLAEGAPIEAGLQALFEAAQGRVWVLHHAGLDIAFLKQACARWAGTLPGFIVLDTLHIVYRLRRRRELPVRSGDLQLNRIRSLYGLPRYLAHDALNDAVATAELMLAIAAQMEARAGLGLRPHIRFF